MARTKPTDKYKDFEAKIRRQHAYIAAQINNKIEWLPPTAHKDGMSRGGDSINTLGFVMEDWINETLVVRIAETVAGARRFLVIEGTLPESIEKLTKSLVCIDRREGRYAAQVEWIRQLKDLAQRFDADGGKKIPGSTQTKAELEQIFNLEPGSLAEGGTR